MLHRHSAVRLDRPGEEVGVLRPNLDDAILAHGSRVLFADGSLVAARLSRQGSIPWLSAKI